MLRNTNQRNRLTHHEENWCKKSIVVLQKIRKMEIKKSDIKLSITLDETKQPVAIFWQADDSGMEGMQESKSMMLSLWDKQQGSMMRIDLWTHEMMVEEMQHFFYQTFASMADTYQRATNDKEMTEEIRKFAKNFGEKTKVIL